MSKKQSGSQRTVIYPDIKHESGRGKNAITVEKAKKLLGWAEVGDDKKKDFLFTDRFGRRVVCLNNPHNRPFYMNTVCEALVQVILTKNWNYNAEPVIIGNTGSILNGQHTLVSVVLAEQDRTGKNKDHWAKFWNGPITIDKDVVYGVSEEDKVVNTLDTCKARSLSDVIFRGPYFPKVKTQARQKLAKITASAIGVVWNRTAIKTGVWGMWVKHKTLSRQLEFLDNHPHLLRAVKHIFEEDQENSISQYLSASSSAALLYLMGCSTSEPDGYRNAEVASEKHLDWTHWDKACEFFTLISSREKSFDPVVEQMGYLVDPDTGEKKSEADYMAVFIKAWNLFAEGTKITFKDLSLEYKQDANKGTKVLVMPTVGGIDVGSINNIETTEDDPSPEDIKEAAEAIRKEAEQKKGKKRDEALAEFAKRKGKPAAGPKEPSATVGESGKGDGKPPAPKLKDSAKGKKGGKATPKKKDEEIKEEPEPEGAEFAMPDDATLGEVADIAAEDAAVEEQVEVTEWVEETPPEPVAEAVEWPVEA